MFSFDIMLNNEPFTAVGAPTIRGVSVHYRRDEIVVSGFNEAARVIL